MVNSIKGNGMGTISFPDCTQFDEVLWKMRVFNHHVAEVFLNSGGFRLRKPPKMRKNQRGCSQLINEKDGCDKQ